MRLKQFIFAFVAMLGFAVSASAQQNISVSTVEELRKALTMEVGSQRSAMQRSSAARTTNGKEVLESSYTITVSSDMGVDELMLLATVGEKQKVTIDLNGHTLTGKLINNGVLTIIDSSNPPTGAIVAEGGVAIENNGTIALNSGNIIATTALDNNGTAYIQGASLIGAVEGVDNYENAVAGIINVTLLQKAIDLASGNTEIKLAADITGDVKITQKEGVNIVIDGDGKKFTGIMTVFGDARHDGAETLAIKNVNFVAKAGADACILSPDRTAQNPARYSYSHNVTVENCTFTDPDGSVNCAAIRQNDGGDRNWTVTKCTVDNTMHSLLQVNNVEGMLTVTECTVNSKNGLNLNATVNATITGNNIDVNGYAVRTGVKTGGNLGTAKTLVLENNTLKSDCADGDAVIMFRASSVDMDLSMTENVVDGTTHISGNTADTKIAADANYWNGAAAPVVAGTEIKVNSYYTDAALSTLERNHFGGSIVGYTDENRIWGESWGNAFDSYVIKVLDAEGNVMGTTSLNDVDDIIDGDVEVTWSLNFAGTGSNFWEVEWTTRPSINKMPATVQLWIDGVQVSEGPVKLNAPDDLKKIVAATADADGNITGCYTTVNDAVAKGDHVAILVPGTYNVPTGKDLTVTGAVDGVQFGPIGTPNMGGKNYTFNNVTFNYAAGSTYKGLQHTGDMVYNNCTFNGQVFLYGTSETFNKCTFNQESADAYNVWTYSAKEVAFNECTFNSVGKSVLVYNEGAGATDLVVTETEFIASAAVEGKAAIEIDTSLMPGQTTITIDGETTATGFGSGNVSGNTLWNNKKGDGDGVGDNNANNNNDITVVVNGETVLQPTYEAQIGDTKYKYFTDAIKKVKNGEEVVLLEDYNENVDFTQTKDLSFVLNGNGKTMTGSINITARAGKDAPSTLVIKNFNFKTTETSFNFINSVETNYYPNNITIEGCTFEGPGGDNAVVAVRLKSANNITIKDCTGTGLHSFLQNTAGWNLTIDNVTVNDAAEGAFALGTVQGVTVKNSTIEAGRYGIRLDGQYNNNAVIADNKINAFIPVVVRKASVDGNITFEGNNEFTQTNTDGYWCVIGTTEYKVNGELPTAATGNIEVTLNDSGLNLAGVYGNFGVASIGKATYLTFAAALDAVQDGETIVLTGATGSEIEKEIEFTRDIEFTITGNAPEYALPIVTFQNATVNIKEAEILIPELDARQGAVINVLSSTVHDAGGNSIAKSYYNGAINIDATSTVHMMQVTTMGYINVAGTLNATWQTNVYGNGMITVNNGATFNTAALHLTAQDYSGRDNTDTERVGKPATIVVDAANLNIGKVKSDNGADYSYNSSKGINIGTIDGKNAVLDIKNGAKVNIYMANGETANIGAGGTVNVAASTFNTVCRAADGTATLANAGTVYVTGAANLAAAKVTGNGWFYMDGVSLNANTNLVGAKVGFINGANDVVGSTLKDGWFSVGIGQNAAAATAAAFAQANGITLGNVTVNVSGNATIYTNTDAAYSGWVGSAYSADKTKNTYTLNINSSLARFGYMHVSKDGVLNVKGHSDKKYEYAGNSVDFYVGNFIDNGIVTLDGVDAWAQYSKISVDHAGAVLNIVNGTTYEANCTTGNTNANTFSYYNAGTVNVDETSSANIAKATALVDGAVLNIAGNVTAKGAVTGAGTVNLTTTTAKFAAADGLDVVNSTVREYLVAYADGAYTLNRAVAMIGDNAYASLGEAVKAVQEGETINILDGTLAEGTVKLPATLKNVTFKGAAEHATVLKDMTIMAADGNEFCYEGLTFDGLVFENSRITVTGWRNGSVTVKDFTVNNCTFKNLNDTTNSAPLHFNMDADEAVNGLTFTNNVIDGATGGSKSGIYVQVTGKTVFSNNVINNVAFRPYVVQLTTNDGVADEFVVTGNTFSGSAAGRAQGLGNSAEGTDAVKLVVSNNIFKDITDAQQICYWNFNEATTEAVLEKNYYDINIIEKPNKFYFNSAAKDASDLVAMGVFPYYTELNADGTINEESLSIVPVAVTSNTGYASITEAINAAADGATVEILAGEHSEYVAPWAGNSKHDTEKSITIVGAKEFGTTLTAGMYLGYDDSQCREHNIVVKGIVFKGKGLKVACQQNVTIEDNKFIDITEGQAIAVVGKNINSVVKNNVIENVAAAQGIELRNTLTATVEGNTISGTAHNSLQITSQVGATNSSVTVKDNTMSNWGTAGEGRAMRISNIVTADINGNVMSHTGAPEEFAKVTGSTTLNAAANYWNGVSPLTAGMFTGVEGDPIAALQSYYTDAAKSNLVTFTTSESAAIIGGVYYETLAAAIKGAKSGETITFLKDINENVTVNKNVTINGNGKQYTGTMTGNAGLNVTVQNVNFVNGGFVKNTGGTTGTYTFNGCTFDGAGTYAYPLSFKGAKTINVENCTVKNYLYSFLYVRSSAINVNVKNVTVEDCPSYAVYFASGVTNATIEGLAVKNSNNGFIINNTAVRNLTIKNCTMENVGTAIAEANGEKDINCTFEGVNELGGAVLSEYVKANAVRTGTKYCGTLAEAVEVAQAGALVKLLASKKGAGVVINKNLTIDFNEMTYTVNQTVGSTGTTTLGFQILKGNDVTLKNGTLTSTATVEGSKEVKMLIQNYANLTLENMNLVDATEHIQYALSNNCGNTKLIGNTNITTDAVALDVYDYTSGGYAVPNVTIETTGKIAGKIEVSENINKNLQIKSGTYTMDVTEWCADGLAAAANGAGEWSIVPAKVRATLANGRVYGYATLAEAVNGIQGDATVMLLDNLVMDTKTLAIQSDGYATIVNVKSGNVTIDLNGKTVTVNAAAADVAGQQSGMLISVFHAEPDAHLTLTDSSEDAAGSVVLNVNDAMVYSFFATESPDATVSGKMTIDGGNYTSNGIIANAMIFTDTDEAITINGGNFHLDGVSTTSGYPWMVNTLGNNELQVVIKGGTFNVDVNHQHRPFEVFVPETLALRNNGDGTWTVVPAVAYVTEKLGNTVHEAGNYVHKVGYATLADALAGLKFANQVTMLSDVALENGLTVEAGREFTLDLNGKTVSMNDASAATVAMIKNYGDLTITDSSEEKAGKLSFNSTTPSAANAYASNTISNYGTITVEAGTIENTTVGGGACYALDNYAGSTATINGGKLTAEKTTVRIFNWTNGDAAKATLNVNRGEIYSKDGYAINVNSGNAPSVALNITGGTITTDDTDYNLAVYVINKGTAENFTASVTGGEFNGYFALNGATCTTMAENAVSISDGTFEGVICYDEPAHGFISGGVYNTPVDAAYCADGYAPYALENGKYGVEYLVVDEITIVDGSYDEFVNQNAKTVGTLTYERRLSGYNAWYALFVPFEIPVSYLNENGYEVATFYDVHFSILEGGVVDLTSVPDIHLIKINGGTLKANYPYVIRAKSDASLDLVITLADAKLYSTAKSKLNVVESSTTTTRFEFAGTYVRATGEELTGDASVPFYVISKKGEMAQFADPSSRLSPFRVYMTIWNKDGSHVILNGDPAASVAMRVIGEENEDGTTSIYDVYENVDSNGMIFDLQGRRVLEPQKGGMYIIDGKKVIY